MPTIDVPDPRIENEEETPFSDPSLDFLYGEDSTPRVVGMHPVFEDDQTMIRVYQRQESGGVTYEDHRFFPYFFATREAIGALSDYDRESFKFTRLQGDNHFDFLVATSEWSDHTSLLDWLYMELGYEIPEPDEDGERDIDHRKMDEVSVPGNMTSMFQMQSGITFFGEMTLDEICRMQLDIETYSSTDSFPDPERPGDEIIIVTLSDNRGREIIIAQNRDVSKQKVLEESGATKIHFEDSEEEVISRTREIIMDVDPDTIEGHNVLDFDFRYILKRCELLDVPFGIGRDGSEPYTWESSRTFAEKDIDYLMVSVNGRSIIDTLFLTLDYDVFAREMASHGLKYTAKHFGVAAGSGDEEDRTYIEGGEISDYWDEDPLPLLKYALDDVRETRSVAQILSESPFYLSQILPFPYQDAERKGTATVIEALMTREYLRQRVSVPKADDGRVQESGGFTEIFQTGVFDRIMYSDISSLYPNIMVHWECDPGEKDPIGLFQRMLEQLLDMRLEIKHEMRDLKSTADPDDEEAQARIDLLDAKQSSYKILINSFYGSLGFAFFAWNNIDEADRVAETGQEVLKKMIQQIESDGGEIIEVDTDGVIFTPTDMDIPRDEEAEAQYSKDLTDAMPEGIKVDHDGSFKRAISLKKKNYALLGYDQDPSDMKVKGSSLISRSNEKFGRDFVQQVLEALMEKDVEKIHEIYIRYYEKIVTSSWDVSEFAKSESLKETFEEYHENVRQFEKHGPGHGHPQYARYEVALQDQKRGDSEYAVGDQVEYYVANGPSDSVGDRAKHVRMYNDSLADEDTEYYLDRLQKFAEKFEAFFEGPDFRKVFSPDDGLFGFDASGIEIKREQARPPLSESESVTVPPKPGEIGRPESVNVFDEEYDLYCGRNDNGEVGHHPGDEGWLGNPVKEGEECPVCGDVHEGKGSTLGCYEDYLRGRLEKDGNFRKAFFEKIDEDTRLGCFCPPDPCHTDVIAKVWREKVETDTAR